MAMMRQQFGWLQVFVLKIVEQLYMEDWKKERKWERRKERKEKAKVKAEESE